MYKVETGSDKSINLNLHQPSELTLRALKPVRCNCTGLTKRFEMRWKSLFHRLVFYLPEKPTEDNIPTI